MESIVFTLSVGVVIGGLLLIFVRQLFGKQRSGSGDGGGGAEFFHGESSSESGGGDGGGDGGGSGGGD